MRILITGPSSFSGSFFIEALSKAGHEVVTTLTKTQSCYHGIRLQRLQKSMQYATVHEQICFGDEQFIELVHRESFDVFCHHGAWTESYNSMNYDFEKAFANNTRSMNRVCQILAANGCQKIIVSGSIFAECEEPFSPYGLVKRLTTQTTTFYGTHFGMHVSSFVIPNPFGPLDNPKLIHYLSTEWSANRIPSIRTPEYIRDNIPITLLALGFVHWVEQCPSTVGVSSFKPSGYISTMEDFIQRVAQVFRGATSWECVVDIEPQTDFSQPMKLVNDVPLMGLFQSWNEQVFWDSLIEQHVF